MFWVSVLSLYISVSRGNELKCSASCCGSLDIFILLPTHFTFPGFCLFHEANCFVRISLVVAGLVNYSPSAVTSDPRQCVSSRLLSAGQCSAVWPPWLKRWSKGHVVLVGLCICSCWQEDIVPLFPAHPPALTSQPWLTWFVVAPRSEGGSWIMSSYSLRGGPWLVDYRIALTDQKELWLLSKSPHKER